jgi:hypothetical protein
LKVQSQKGASREGAKTRRGERAGPRTADGFRLTLPGIDREDEVMPPEVKDVASTAIRATPGPDDAPAGADGRVYTPFELMGEFVALVIVAVLVAIVAIGDRWRAREERRRTRSARE